MIAPSISRELASWLRSLIVVGIVWLAVSAAFGLPSAVQTASALLWMIDRGTYFHDILISLIRFLEGWFLGAVVGVGAGLFTGSVRGPWTTGTERVLNLARAVPVISLVPLVVTIWGIGEWSKVVMVAWGVFFPAWIATHEGARHINQNYLNAAMSLGLRGPQLWSRIIIPHVSEKTFVGLRTSVGVGLICVVAAELTGAYEVGFFSQGLGYRIQRAADLYQQDVLLACILTFGGLGILMDFGFRRLSRAVAVHLLGFDPFRSTLRLDAPVAR